MEPELKGLIDDIINLYLTYIDADTLKEFMYGLIGEHYNKGIDAGEVNFNMNFVPDYRTISFIQKYAFDNVTKVTADMKDNLRKEMSIGLMNGESIPQLKLRIVDVMDTTLQRAEMISRTETVRAFNMGHNQTAKDSGLVLMKEWSAQPERISKAGNFVPCPSCESMNGQRIGMNEKFKAENGEEYLLPPAHPHCACRVIYIQK